MTIGPVLILGGTAEARALAALLHAEGVAVITSLAGRVMNPALPVGDVRIGGFGGLAGLVRWLEAHQPLAVVDATHPFAQNISANAARAAVISGVPMLTVRRPKWEPRTRDEWIDVPDIASAADAVAELSSHRRDLRVFLTTGRQDVDVFGHIDEAWFLIRLVDPPERDVPPRSMILRSRGPYTLDTERELLLVNAIDVIVTKNSGGELVSAKLEAARELSVPVIMVARPAIAHDGAHVHTAAEAAQWVGGLVP